MNTKIDKKVKKNKIKLMIMSMILFLAILFIMISQATIFNIKKILVEGNHELSKERVAMASGIIIGENIFKLDVKNSKENLLLHPYIKEVEIKREFPNRLTIKILEKEEIAAIKYMDSYVYIGAGGLVLDILNEKKENDIPLVSGVEIEHPSIGSKISYKKNKNGQDDKITNFMELCNKKKLSSKIKILEFNNNKVNIALNSGANIVFGSLDDIEYKLSFLIETLEDLEEKKTKVKNIHLDKSSDIIVEIVDS